MTTIAPQTEPTATTEKTAPPHMMAEFSRDFFKYIPSKIIPGFLGFIAIPIITNIFAPGAYGDYSVVTATVSIFIALTSWITMAIIRFYPVYEKQQAENRFLIQVFLNLFFSLLIISGIYFIAIVVMKSRLSASLYNLFLIGFVMLIAESMFLTLQNIFRARRLINWYSGFAVYYSFGKLLIALALIFLFGVGIGSLFWGVTIAIVIALPVMVKILHIAPEKTSEEPLFSIDVSTMKIMASYSIPLVIGELASWVLSLGDRYILQIFRGATEVGVYSASYNIATQSVLVFIQIFMLASGPLGIRIWENQGERKSQEFVARLCRYYLLCCIPIVVIISTLAAPLISLLTGNEYHGGFIIIPFVTAGVFFLGLQQIYQTGILFHKKTTYITKGLIYSGVANVALNALFIPRFGFLAAGCTTLVSYCILMLYIRFRARGFYRFAFPGRSLRSALIASGIMGTVVFLVSQILVVPLLAKILLCGIIGLILYAVLLLLQKELTPSEINLVLTYTRAVKVRAKQIVRLQ